MPCSSSMRAIAAPTWPPPKTTTSSTAPSPGREQLAPLARRLGRADHDDPVARRDHVVAARERHRVAADDRRGPASPPGSAHSRSGTADDRRARALAWTSNSTICTWPSAKTSVCRAAGTPIDAGDGVRGLELGGDDEVDVEPPLAPELDVLDVRRADHRRRPRRLEPREDRRRRGSPRRATCTR